MFLVLENEDLLRIVNSLRVYLDVSGPCESGQSNRISRINPRVVDRPRVRDGRATFGEHHHPKTNASSCDRLTFQTGNS